MRLKRHHKVIIGLASVALATTAYVSLQTKHIGPKEVYPDPQYTTGVIATSDFNELTQTSSCGTYSQCHRNTTANMKRMICIEYPQNCDGTQETDHFVPICAGGADNVKNLWDEPAHFMFNNQDLGFHTKDLLEAEVCREIKSGEIAPLEAQQKILKDWVAYYQELVKNGKIKGTVFGSVTFDLDGDIVGNYVMSFLP